MQYNIVNGFQFRRGVSGFILIMYLRLSENNYLCTYYLAIVTPLCDRGAVIRQHVTYYTSRDLFVSREINSARPNDSFV